MENKILGLLLLTPLVWFLLAMIIGIVMLRIDKEKNSEYVTSPAAFLASILTLALWGVYLLKSL